LFLFLMIFVVGGHITAWFVTSVGDFLCWRAQKNFLATANALFPCSRAPRTFLGDRKRSFPLFSGSKNLSWRAQTLFPPVLGMQEPSSATAKTPHPRSRAPRIIATMKPLQLLSSHLPPRLIQDAPFAQLMVLQVLVLQQ
jgi:hypothetical protein